MRALLITITGLLCAGCVDPAPAQCSEQPPTVTNPRLLLGYAGVSSSHFLKVPCVRPDAKASSVLVSLSDPQGNPVPFTVTEPEPYFEGFSASLEFTPPVPGSYSVTASFEPQLGTLTARIIILRDRRNEPPVAMLTTPDECLQVEVGGPLIGCQSNRTRVFLDGGLVFDDVRSGARGAADALWVWSDAGVSRLEGTDRITLASPLPGYVSSVSATNDSLVLSAGGDLIEYALRNGALERSVLLADAGLSNTVVPVDGGWISATEQRSCFVSVGAPPRCVEWSRSLIGPEANGLWVRGALSAAEVSFLGFEASPQPTLAVEVDLSNSSITQTFQLNTNSGLPVFNRSVTLRADDFTLEEWPQFPIARARSGYFIGLNGRQVTIFKR